MAEQYKSFDIQAIPKRIWKYDTPGSGKTISLKFHILLQKTV